MGAPNQKSAPIEVRLAASLAHLPTLRALTETIGLLGDLTLDEVADLRLAVDEVASTLLITAQPDSALSAQFTIGAEETRVRMDATARSTGLPDEDSFGWHVLRTLTDSISTAQDNFDPALSGYPTSIEFVRARAASQDIH